MKIDEISLEELFDEITKIRQLLEIMLRETLKKELEKIATTPERKKMWALFNGLLNTEEIAKKVGVTQRAVQIFVKELRAKEWVVTKKRGYPKRRFDYIPSDWNVERE